MENQQKEEPMVFYLNKRYIVSPYRGGVIGLLVGVILVLLLFFLMAMEENDWGMFWMMLVCFALAFGPAMLCLGFFYGKALKAPTKITLFSDKVLFDNTVFYFRDILSVKMPSSNAIFAIRFITFFHTGGKTSYLVSGGRRDVNQSFPDYERFYYSLNTAMANKRGNS